MRRGASSVLGEDRSRYLSRLGGRARFVARCTQSLGRKFVSYPDAIGETVFGKALAADIRQQVAGVLDEADRDAACRFVLGEF